MTIKDVTNALQIAGINPPSEVSSKEVIKLFHDQKGEIYTISTAKMVKFLLALGFPYSNFLDCDRTGLNKAIEGILKIDDEPEKSKFRKALDGISDLFGGKGKSGIQLSLHRLSIISCLNMTASKSSLRMKAYLILVRIIQFTTPMLMGHQKVLI